MLRFAFFLLFLISAAGCLVEDKPVTPPDDGGVDSGILCGTVICPEDRPLCSTDLICVQCTAEDDDYCAEGGLICDLGSSTCVGCVGDSDCTDPAAARCDENVCTQCNDNAQCDGVDGLDAENNACDDEGVCVGCTPETEGTTCPGALACHPVTQECTSIQVGSLDVCEECVSDSQCGDEGSASDAHRCVPMFYEFPDTRFPNEDVGFCLKTTDGGCVQPYSVTLTNRESLSGEPADDYCGVREQLATCPAVKALAEGVECPTGDPLQCPQPSGLCEQVGDLPNRCTYACEVAQHCLPIGSDPENPNPGSTCGSSGSGGDDYCGG